MVSCAVALVVLYLYLALYVMVFVPFVGFLPPRLQSLLYHTNGDGVYPRALLVHPARTSVGPGPGAHQSQMCVLRRPSREAPSSSPKERVTSKHDRHTTILPPPEESALTMAGGCCRGVFSSPPTRAWRYSRAEE